MKKSVTQYTLISQLSLMLLVSIGNATAQVGIGDFSHPAAMLNIKSPSGTQGLLIPFTDDVTNVTDAANGLLIYQDLYNQFSYSKGGVWTYLNPWYTNEITASSPSLSYALTDYQVGIGTGTVDEALVVDGNILANQNVISSADLVVDGTITAYQFSGRGMVPIGGIIMWSGASIPQGYALCNGSNGTPNLTNDFIEGHTQGASPSSDFEYNENGSGLQTIPYYRLAFIMRTE